MLSAFLFTIVFCTTLTASAAEQGFYAGVSGGESRMDKKDLLWNFDVAKWPATFIGDFDLTGTAYKIFGGYRFTKNLAVEAAYGKMEGIVLTVNDTGGGNLRLEIEGVTASVIGVGMVPFDNGITLLAKIGMARNDGKFSCTSSGTLAGVCATIADPAASWDPIHGFGVSYDITKSLAARLEWEQVRDSREGDSVGFELTTFGVQYNF